MDRYTLITLLSTYSRYLLYSELMAVYLNEDLFISYPILVVILGIFYLMDPLLIWVLGHIFCGCIGWVAVDYQVNVTLLCVKGWRSV